MKIVMMKKKKEPPKKDMFTVLSLVQSVLVITIILTLFAFSRVNSEALADIGNNLSVIFEDDMDIGGYFTPSEEKNTEEETSEEEFSAPVEEIAFSEKTQLLQMELPVPEDTAVMPVIGTVTSDYGTREHPVYSGESFHAGRDIAAAEGDPVYSVLDGVVKEAGEARMAGKYVRILHPDGSETLYCHCSELIAKKGDEVKKGDIIARVGQTGLATGPHLHFEFHKNGKASDPEEILEGAVNVR